MVKKRIIPCLDVDNGRVVKGTNFVDIIDAGDPIALAKKYEKEGADELVFLDITASSDKRSIIKSLVQQVAKEIFIPFTVGGGINNVETIQEILNLGADKVSINTAAIHNPGLINDAARHFGSQCIVVAIDIKRVSGSIQRVAKPDSQLNAIKSNETTIADVYSHGGRNNCGIDAIKWAMYCESMGAGELLVTSMDADGTQDGYDVDILKEIKRNVRIPVIASGGAGSIDHIKDALLVADAALLASLLHFNKLSIPEIKDYLMSNTLNIRSI